MVAPSESGPPPQNVTIGSSAETALPPTVELRRIKKIPTYEVMETDLDSLNRASIWETLSFGFLTLAIGVIASAVLAVPGAQATKQAWGLWYGSLFAFGAMALVGAVVFVISIVTRRSIVKRLKQNEITAQPQPVGVTPPASSPSAPPP